MWPVSGQRSPRKPRWGSQHMAPCALGDGGGVSFMGSQPDARVHTPVSAPLWSEVTPLWGLVFGSVCQCLIPDLSLSQAPGISLALPPPHAPALHGLCTCRPSLPGVQLHVRWLRGLLCGSLMPPKLRSLTVVWPGGPCLPVCFGTGASSRMSERPWTAIFGRPRHPTAPQPTCLLHLCVPFPFACQLTSLKSFYLKDRA